MAYHFSHTLYSENCARGLRGSTRQVLRRVSFPYPKVQRFEFNHHVTDSLRLQSSCSYVCPKKVLRAAHRAFRCSSIHRLGARSCTFRTTCDEYRSSSCRHTPSPSPRGFQRCYDPCTTLAPTRAMQRTKLQQDMRYNRIKWLVTSQNNGSLSFIQGRHGIQHALR